MLQMSQMGNHESLCRLRGLYWRLIKQQQEGESVRGPA